MGHLTSYYGDLSSRDYVWDEPLMIWPRKNVLTGKRMMPFSRVTRGRIKTDVGPISILYGDYIALWMRPEELIMEKLKGNA